MKWRFTLIHDDLGSQEISEPGGWINHKLKLIRHPVFFSLVESIEAELIFYGSNGIVDGGINFINQVEQTYGFDADIRLFIEIDEQDENNYQDYFDGVLPIHALERFPNNTATIPLLKNNLWAKLLSRWETPVSLSSLVDLNGNAVDPVEPSIISLTPQIINRNYQAHIDDGGLGYAQFTNDTYYQIDFSDVVILDEIKERYTLLSIDNPEIPSANFVVQEAGFHVFDIRIIASTFTVFNAESLKNPTDFIDFYIQIGKQAPIPFSWSDETVGAGVWTVFTLSDTYELRANTTIRIYGRANTTSAKDLIILGGSSAGFSGSSEFASYCNILAKTTRETTEAQGYLIHDLIHGTLARIGLGTNPFYSEFLGSTGTKARQYDEDGCGWMYFIIKGLQLRQYTLEEKPFFISMKDIWDGINPILNLGLGYEEVEGTQVIRIEQKRHFVGQ